MRKKAKEIDIVFDGEDPLINIKSDLKLKMDRIEQLNKEIGIWKGFVYGILFATFINIIIFLCLFNIFI